MQRASRHSTLTTRDDYDMQTVSPAGSLPGGHLTGRQQPGPCRTGPAADPVWSLAGPATDRFRSPPTRRAARRVGGELLAGSARGPRRPGGGVGERTLTGFAFGSVTFISAQGDPHAPKRGLTPHSTPHSVPPKPSHAPWGARGAPAEEIDRVMGGSFLALVDSCDRRSSQQDRVRCDLVRRGSRRPA